MTNVTDLTSSPLLDAHAVFMNKTHPTDARFWKRAYATLVDSIIIITILNISFVTFFVIFFIFNQVLLSHFWQKSQEFINSSYWLHIALIYFGLYFVLTKLISIIYYCYYLFSTDQATPGMKLHSLKLVNAQGNRVSFGRVFLRELASIVSFWGFFIGYLMILFTKRRQTLHDMVTSTYVQDDVEYPNADILIAKNYQNFIYGGFWRRLGAHIVDEFIIFILFCLIIFILYFSLSYFFNSISSNNTNQRTLDLDREKVLQFVSFLFLCYFILIFYRIFFIASKFQATPGKMLFSLKVIDNQGSRLTIFRSFVRCHSGLFSDIIFRIGFIMIALTKRKQGLHDKIALTYVIRVLKKAKNDRINNA